MKSSEAAILMELSQAVAELAAQQLGHDFDRKQDLFARWQCPSLAVGRQTSGGHYLKFLGETRSFAVSRKPQTTSTVN